MKSMIHCYKLFFIICLLTISFAEILKPSNDKYDIVKITDENNKTRTYFQLKGENPLVFESLDDFVSEKNENYAVKIISRAKISPSSSSSKTFGINLQIFDNGSLTINKDLTYKKGASSAKKSTKSGFNYTQGGFWFEELGDIKNKKILIRKMDGSPAIDVRVVVDKIKKRGGYKVVKPVNKEKAFKVSFLKKGEKEEYTTTSGWHNLKNNEKIQYKIKGPTEIRVLTRSIINNQNTAYNLNINENGRYKSDLLYDIKASKRDAHCYINENKVNLSNYNSFFFNVPSGIHYYSLQASDEYNQEIFVKLQSPEIK